jgi:hypothetical protein
MTTVDLCDHYESCQEPEQPDSVCFHCGHLRSEHKKSWKLGSDDMVNAAGILRWAINGYAFKSDRKKIMNVMHTWSGPSDETYHRLLMGEIPYTVDEDGSVKFTE